MSGKSKYELEIVARCIRIRTEYKKTQSYFAMLLDVSDGYVGHVENPNRPEMYTHDQLNAIALDLKCSPRQFYPDAPIKQKLPKRNVSLRLERKEMIKISITDMMKSGFFSKKRYSAEILNKLVKSSNKILSEVTSKDATDVLRIFVKDGILKISKEGTRNLYFTEIPK